MDQCQAILERLPPPPLDPLERLNEERKDKWARGRKLGEGTYANVFLGSSKTDPSLLVAIKKIKINKEYIDGMAPDAIREQMALMELRHHNIIRYYDAFTSTDMSLSLVLEYLPRGDLEVLILDKDVSYGAADIKAWLLMILRGVWYCHARFWLHRDIKPNNVLIAGDGELKLADFGLARPFADPHQHMSPNVITRWYRPPELFFGARHYSAAVDMWSVGMLFAQLANRRPWITGNTDPETVTQLHRELGGIADDVWPGVSSLPQYVGPGPNPERPRDIRYYTQQFPHLGPDGCKLLKNMLMLIPSQRITAKDALAHPYFLKEPLPTVKEALPRVPDKKRGQAIDKMAGDLAREPVAVVNDRGRPVARRLDFSAAR